MKNLLKRKNKISTTILFGFVMFFLGLTYITYAVSYNSEEISYDNSTSHASATNVKDAIDYLYSHGSCGEGMSCFESPDVIINVSGPGEVSEVNIKVPVYGRKQVTVNPNSGYVLRSFSCNNGYTLSDFKTLTILAADSQNIDIINSGILTNATCEVQFGLNELVEVDIGSSISVGTAYNGDLLNDAQKGAICWYINEYETGILESEHRGEFFDYDSHVGCKFKSYICKSTTNKSYNCSNLNWDSWGGYHWRATGTSDSAGTICSGIIECLT